VIRRFFPVTIQIDAVILHIGDINVEENADCCWMHLEVEIIQQDLYLQRIWLIGSLKNQS